MRLFVMMGEGRGKKKKGGRAGHGMDRRDPNENLLIKYNLGVKTVSQTVNINVSC